MKLLSPVEPAGMVSSTIPETDYAAWSAATDYTIGARVIRTTTHKIYESVTGGIDATIPELALGGTTPKWIEVKSTNRWAMFNDSLDDPSTSATAITTVVSTGGIEGVALLGLVGKEVTVTVTDTISSAVIFTETRTIDSSVITDFADWFFINPDYTADIIFQGIPVSFSDVQLSVSIEPGSDGAACGVCKFGTIDFIGNTLYGATIGIIDYSVETLDSFGFLQVTERGFVKSVQVKMITDKIDFARIFKLVSRRRAIPTVYIATDVSGYEPLIVYGLFYDFSIDIAYPQHNYCTLEVHGMVQQ